MCGLTCEGLAAIYELRKGYDRPTSWKWIAREFDISRHALLRAIKKLERSGFIQDANQTQYR